jgi:HCOMODA/2-hydroxy-3-carboxy-muconic semialdehyde decarboxylase
LIEDLVAANRILYDQGVVDGFGHVSARHDKHADRFLLARNMAPGLVTTADIMSFDLDGNALGGDTRTAYLERFIHSEIYRARHDVMAVVHSHSQTVIPFGLVAGVPLRPVFHMGSFLPARTPIFEIREPAGPASDMLIRSPELGVALSRSLGSGAAVLMRGHGATVVGSTLRQAVFQAVYTEVNAQIQVEALRLGPVNYLTEEEAANAARTIAGQINRAWELWRMKALLQEG